MHYKFSERVHKVLRLAKYEAHRMGEDAVSCEHLLLGIMEEGEGVAWTLLRGADVDAKNLIRALRDGSSFQEVSLTMQPELPYTNRAKQAMEEAMSLSRRLEKKEVGTQHLLLGILQVESKARKLLEEAGMTFEQGYHRLVHLMGSKQDLRLTSLQEALLTDVSYLGDLLDRIKEIVVKRSQAPEALLLLQADLQMKRIREGVARIQG